MTHSPFFDFVTQFAAIDTPDTADEVRRIEDALQVRLPVDFRRLWEYVPECVPDQAPDRFAMRSPGDEGIVALTTDFRRDLELPRPYVVLAADDDVILMLACAGAAHGEGAVHLIPRAGLGIFMLGGQPRNARRWVTFVDYVADLLESDDEPSGTPR